MVFAAEDHAAQRALSGVIVNRYVRVAEEDLESLPDAAHVPDRFAEHTRRQCRRRQRPGVDLLQNWLGFFVSKTQALVRRARLRATLYFVEATDQVENGAALLRMLIFDLDELAANMGPAVREAEPACLF